MSYFKNNRAFTLIELLIVVAIIAILAAIAVPNFLEAQTRSKISRAKADMRTLNTGLESYRVDNTHYPPDYGFEEWRSWLMLTTPIAYLTGFVYEPFGSKFTPGSEDSNNPVPIDPTTHPFYQPNGKPMFLYSSYSIDANGNPNPHPFFAPDGAALGLPGTGNKWYWLLSVGPDQKLAMDDERAFDDEPWAYHINKSYDPTNGTISYGDIIRTNREQKN